MAVKLKWNGKQLTKKMTDALAVGLEAATLDLHRIARDNASVPNPGETVRITRPRKGGNASSRTVYRHSSRGSASPPGESPRTRTGFGQKNIVWGFSRTRMEGRVGYTRLARYMTFHELGIRYAKQGLQYRQTILPSIADNLGRLRAIFESESKRAFK